MNCAECRDNLVACAEGLLDRETLLECRAHLETCASCRAEYQAIASLQQRLVARGQAAAEVSLVAPVMQRVLQKQRESEGESFMSKILKHRWGFGLGTATGAAAILLIALLTLPKMQATAEEVMTRGAQVVAKLTSIRFRGELRTWPVDNFGYINADCPFCPIELWKQFEPQLKWRIEKPGRVVVMDGESTVMLLKPEHVAVKHPFRTTSAFDTDWLQQIANVSETISNELDNARAKGWKLSLKQEAGTDGRLESVVTILAKTTVPANDYEKNNWIWTADTRRVYRFDAQSGLLEAMQVYLLRPSGDVKIFDLSQIDYNQPIEPGVWTLELPADVSWVQNQLPTLTNNAVYAAMTPEQAAKAFFEACSRNDWGEAGKFLVESPVPNMLKQKLGGLQIISIGTAFTSAAGKDQIVPYEIKLQYGTNRKWNLALAKDQASGRWFVDGGLP